MNSRLVNQQYHHPMARGANLQEAFFSRKEMNQDDIDIISHNANEVSEDSLDGANFRILQAENLVESFSQISPNNKVPIYDMYTFNPTGYAIEEIKFDSLVLPPFDPNKSYFEAYWSLYQANEQLMMQMNEEAEERDSALRSILKIELFYNNQENLDRI